MIEKTLACIFMGPQGSGKGTQLSLLKTYLTDRDGKESIWHAETGAEFRRLQNEDSFTGSQLKDLLEDGKIVPDFFPVYLFAKSMIDNLLEGQHMLIDGFPRTILQAQALDSAFTFYGIGSVNVLYFDVSEDEVIRRMLSRGREDDTEDKIKRRLAWTKEHTDSIMEFFNKGDRYNIHSMDASRSIDEIHQDIISCLNLEK